MSLDLYLNCESCNESESFNITHNLGGMATTAGLYHTLWRPEECGIEKAKDLIPRLEKGIELLKKYPEFFKTFESPNGWGTYKNFVPFCEEVLKACREYPNHNVEASR